MAEQASTRARGRLTERAYAYMRDGILGGHLYSSDYAGSRGAAAEWSTR